ncbi:hypothetical protein PENDEC_c025G04803 [Penicillium decumbens]|uniref:Uncharacterized protein n=1 Tax=Penicillium decumbens TaxID=69771 RepID=A0A1V6P011_PENDC|nr:hypothetical protein PENDEC_c025G04803 [Penicillium decumbens]
MASSAHTFQTSKAGQPQSQQPNTGDLGGDLLAHLSVVVALPAGLRDCLLDTNTNTPYHRLFQLQSLS